MKMLARLLAILLFTVPAYADSSFVASVPAMVITNNAAGVALTTNVAKTITSVQITSPGTWLVTDQVVYIPAVTTTMTYSEAQVSATTDFDNGITTFVTTHIEGATTGANAQQAIPSPNVYVTVAPGSTPTYYCIARAGFSISTMAASCKMTAVRLPL